MGRVAFILFLTICWFVFCSWWYVCGVKEKCADPPTVENVIEKEVGPLVFNWSDPAGVTNSKWPAYKSDITTKMSKDNLLEITGHYFADEENTSEYDNMGLARANSVKELLIDKIPEDRIVLKSEVATATDEVRTEVFESASMKWTTPPTETDAVIELENQTIIYFPSNSNRRIINPKIEAYMKKLREKIEAENITVTITGHTDSQGPANQNEKLGLSRANKIKRSLMKKGIDESKIVIVSKGETDPVATNSDREGRSKNRRAVITWSK